MNIDITFNFYSDSNGGDPDLKSPTLRKYHQFLWNKYLPNGEFMDLSNTPTNLYLSHNSRLGSLSLGSDSIVHSYKNQIKKQWLISKIPEGEVDELRNLGSTEDGHWILEVEVFSMEPVNRMIRSMPDDILLIN